MNRLNRSALKLFVVAALCASSVAALAMPKAAEHEDAQVTSGVDAARPKRSAIAAKPPTTANAKPAGAAGKTHAAGKTAKPGAGSSKAPKSGKAAKTAKHASKPAARPAKTAKTTHR